MRMQMLSHAMARCLVLLCICVVLQRVRAKGTEISTSVVITGFYDFDGGVGQSQCERAVQNSKGYNAKKINFVITLSAVGELKTLYRYYYKDSFGNLVPADAGTIGRFKDGLRKCFKAGLDAGFTTLHIVPHVDPREKSTNSRGLWRNVVKFDPLAKYGPDGGSAYTNEDVLLRPAAEALNSVIGYNTVVEFTISAEQGLSVWSFPRKYIKLLGSTKAVSARGKNAAKHLFGVSFNYDKVCGCVEPDEKDPILYNNTYIERFGRFKAAGGLSEVDVQGLKGLLKAADFIGLSSYAPLPRQLFLPAMEVSIQTVAFELQPFGVNFKSYLFAGNKPLVYSEQGFGGCTENGGIAPDLAFAIKHPFWGAWPPGGYSSSADPWQVPQYKEYRRQLYQLLSTWARNGGGPQYRIDGIFVWTVGTWDILGVHPASTQNGGSYGDDVIRNYVRQANAAVNRRGAAVPAATVTESGRRQQG